MARDSEKGELDRKGKDGQARDELKLKPEWIKVGQGEEGEKKGEEG